MKVRLIKETMPATSGEWNHQTRDIALARVAALLVLHPTAQVAECLEARPFNPRRKDSVLIVLVNEVR